MSPRTALVLCFAYGIARRRKSQTADSSHAFSSQRDEIFIERILNVTPRPYTSILCFACGVARRRENSDGALTMPQHLAPFGERWRSGTSGFSV